MNELTALITQESAKIFCNFEQVKKALQDRLSEYKGAVFTEDSKAMAKKHVASLRAQKKTFQDNLREEKRRYMEPWDRFESQAKALIAMYDEPIDFINGQVQEFEAKRIERKREQITGIYDELVPRSLREYIPLSGVYNAIVPNPVILRPYRTFPEVEQPASSFIFRMKENDGVCCALFEADGGAWKNEAMRNIKEYLKENLCDLLDQFTVIS